jgi:HEAT repeat protein
MARGGLDSEIARLKHRDVRHRRRAIRVLFDTDIPRALEGFVPLLNDKDPWFRSKALEAHRKWAPKQGIDSLRTLATHTWLDARRCAANLLGDFSQDTTEIALLLIEDDDLTCTRKAAEALLKGEQSIKYSSEFQSHSDSAIRRLAVLSKSANAEHRNAALADESNSVSEAAIQAVVDNGETLTEDSMKKILKRGLSTKPLLSSAVQNAGEVLVEIAANADGQTMKTLVKELRSQCDSLEDDALQVLLKNEMYAVVGRWMQGKKSQEIDALRWKIVRDNSVDVIERARLLERLIGRCGEVEIAEENRRFLDECTDELLRISAENLSTASTELGL